MHDHVGVRFLVADAAGRLRTIHRRGRTIDLGREQAVARRTTLVDGVTRILGQNGRAVGIFPIDRRGGALGVAEVSTLRRSLELRRHEVEAWIGRLSDELHRRTEQRRRRRELEIGLAWTAHELRGPLLAARLRLERAAGSLTSGGAEPVAKAIGELSRLADGLESILHWAVGDMAIRRRQIDICELTAEAIECAVMETGEDRVVVEGCERLAVMGDPLHLRSAIENVVRNALLYSTPGTKVRVSVDRCDADAIVKVENEGSRIPSADRGWMFEPLSRGAPGSGFGLGLFVARRVVERHGGTIRCLPLDDGHVAFELRLPRGVEA